MKRLQLVNVIILLALFCAVILPDYYMNSSSYVSITDSLDRSSWMIFVGILAAAALLSALLAFIPLKRFSYLHRLLGVNTLFNTAFLLFISYYGIGEVVDFQREYEVLSLQYKARAESDIRNEHIIYETAGFQIPSDSVEQAKEDKIDSLWRAYGIEYSNTGCMISAPLSKAQSDYEQIVELYLNKRNGAGWRDRINLQIEKIRDDKF